MNKLNRFLLAEDPRSSLEGGTAIIHTIEPYSIIGVIHELVEHTQPYRHFIYNEEESVTLYVHHMFTTNMAAADEVESDKMIDKLLNRAWHWYKSYLEWEDQNLNEQDEAERN